MISRMKIKFKRYLSLFCVLLMIISTLVDGLSTTVQATINSSQNLTNNSDNIEVYSTSNITVYNDRNNNGFRHHCMLYGIGASSTILDI